VSEYGVRARAVLLDLDGTLVDTHATMRAVVVRALESLVGALPESSRQAIADHWIDDPSRHFHRYEIGELSFAEQRRARYTEVAAIADAPVSDELYAQWEIAYEAGLGAEVRPFDDVDGFLDRLGSIPVAVVTNVRTDFQRAKLGAAGLAARLPVVVGVDLAGAPKPDPAPFLLACTLLGVEPVEAVHIGDSLTADIEGARAAGLGAIWLDRPGAGDDGDLPAGAHRVASLTAAIGLVGSFT
jgi:putative hydrolase of the HAD superfamily